MNAHDPRLQPNRNQVIPKEPETEADTRASEWTWHIHERVRCRADDIEYDVPPCSDRPGSDKS
jgi:hypothetical protein